MADPTATFMSITGSQATTAERLLEMFDGNLDRAVNYFFENPGLDLQQPMSEEDARAAAQALQEQEEAAGAAARGPENQPIDLTGTSPPAGPRHVAEALAARRAAAPAPPIVQEPEEVDMIVDDDEEDDPDAQLRRMAAHRTAGMAAARQAQRTMEDMMGMAQQMLGAHGMPTMFPGLASDGVGPPGLFPTGHPITGLDVDSDEDMAMLPGRLSARSPAGSRRAGASSRAGLEVRGIPIHRGEGSGAAVDTMESDEAMARRLAAEYDQQAAGLDAMGAGPHMEAEPARMARAIADPDMEPEHVDLGVDRHELEEARMIEAAMLGIPYEPRLPPRRSAGPSIPADPAVNEQRNLRWEQDQAFEESLALDRAKAESAARAAQEAEEVARREQEAAEAEARAAAEQEARTKALLAQKAANLPAEPAAGSPDVVSVMLRMPDGSRMSRRFSTGHPLQALFDFIDVENQATSLQPGSYNLVNSYPRKVFKPDTPGTLGDAGITADTALFVEPAA